VPLLTANEVASTWEKAMKILLLVLGVASVLMGGLWMGQGAGYIHWPASSFMISETRWIWRGAILLLVGVALIVWSRRRV
jgi:hypothetical protein